MSNQAELTPCGRVPGSSLPSRHEKVAHALIRGASNRQAGLEGEFKDGPGLPGNISRLRRTPEMQERLAELAQIAAEDATIEDRWLLEDLKLFRKATPAWFWKRDARGKLVLRRGKPTIDFSHATEEQLRCLSEFTQERGRVKIRVHDPMVAIDKLARHRSLYRDKVALTDPNGDPVKVIHEVCWKTSPPNDAASPPSGSL
jgi:hypothetical protein